MGMYVPGGMREAWISVCPLGEFLGDCDVLDCRISSPSLAKGFLRAGLPLLVSKGLGLGVWMSGI
jgi:hypothetical protein